VTESVAEYSDKRFQLYIDYLKHQHDKGGMENSSKEDFIQFLMTDWCDTIFIEFHLNDELVAVAVTDVTPFGLSALYTFYSPEYANRSLGVFAILKQIELCKNRQLPWLFLGYWIEECKKMMYKTDYQPLEIFDENHWLKQTDYS
jgi:arginine-tRNA-protein transferase